MKYSMGFKASLVKKTQDGSGRSIGQVARESGVSYQTLASWIQSYQAGTLSVDGSEAVTPDQRTSSEKLALLLESKTLSEAELGAWLRQQGLHAEYLPLWEQDLLTMINKKDVETITDNALLRKEVKRLQKELDRKDKALAETAVLLTLKKNSSISLRRPASKRPPYHCGRTGGNYRVCGISQSARDFRTYYVPLLWDSSKNLAELEKNRNAG
jgi:transposase